MVALLCLSAGESPAEQPDGVLGALVSAASNAPEPMHEGIAKTYRASTLRPDGLKACILLAHGIDRTLAETEGTRAALRRLDDRIAEAGPRLNALAAAGLTDKAKRAEYEAGLTEYNGHVEERASIAADHNRRVREYGEMAARFETNCNGRAFFPSDLAALRAELPAEVLARLK